MGGQGKARQKKKKRQGKKAGKSRVMMMVITPSCLVWLSVIEARQIESRIASEAIFVITDNVHSPHSSSRATVALHQGLEVGAGYQLELTNNLTSLVRT